MGATVTQFPTPTLISGSLRTLSATVSTAASNTKVSIPALTVVAVTRRFNPEATSSATTALPSTFDNIGWRMDTDIIPLSDAGVTRASTITVALRLISTLASTVVPDVALYIGTTQIGTGTGASTALAANTAATVNVTITVAAGVTIPANGRLAMGVSTTATNIDALTAAVITLLYTNTGTSVSALTYTINAARTTSDSFTLTDSAQRVVSAVRSGSDVLPASTDVSTRQTSNFRRSTDTMAVTIDTASRIYTAPRTASEIYPATVDAASRQTSDFRRTVETLAATVDTAVRSLTFTRTTTDAHTYTDTAIRSTALARTGTDANPAMVDTASRTQALARRGSETTSQTDAASRTTSASRTSSDSQAFVDTAQRTQSLARRTSDSQAFVDTALRSTALFRTGSDANPAMVDSATRQTSLIRRASDVLPNMTDTAIRVLVRSITATESVVTLDSAIRSLTFLRVTQDQFQPVDDPPSNQVKMVAGFVYNTDGTPYLGGATVILIREDGVVVQTTTSSLTDGSYNFPRNFLDTHTYTVAAHTSINGSPFQAVTPRALLPV